MTVQRRFVAQALWWFCVVMALVLRYGVVDYVGVWSDGRLTVSPLAFNLIDTMSWAVAGATFLWLSSYASNGGG